MGKGKSMNELLVESHSSPKDSKRIYVSSLSSQLEVLSSRALLSPLNHSNVEMSICEIHSQILCSSV